MTLLAVIDVPHDAARTSPFSVAVVDPLRLPAEAFAAVIAQDPRIGEVIMHGDVDMIPDNFAGVIVLSVHEDKQLKSMLGEIADLQPGCPVVLVIGPACTPRHHDLVTYPGIAVRPADPTVEALTQAICDIATTARV